MSNISSSRKGRPNREKDSDWVTLSGDFRKAAGEWQPEKPDPRLGRWIGDGSEPQFELTLDCMADPYDPNALEPIPMTDFVVEPTKFRRGPVSVYRLTLKNERATLVDRHTVIPPDAEEVDLCACPDATDEEIRVALAYEPPPPAKRASAPAPTYRRISRAEDQASSRLGFQAGAIAAHRGRAEVVMPCVSSQQSAHCRSPQRDTRNSREMRPIARTESFRSRWTVCTRPQHAARHHFI